MSVFVYGTVCFHFLGTKFTFFLFLNSFYGIDVQLLIYVQSVTETTQVQKLLRNHAPGHVKHSNRGIVTHCAQKYMLKERR